MTGPDAVELIARGDREALTAGLLAAGPLDDLFAELIWRGQYDAMLALLRRGTPGETPVLRALGAARPTYDAVALNAASLASLSPGRAEYDLLIVPGFTPTNANTPVPLASSAPTLARLAAAKSDLDAFRAPAILVTGGSVHPPGTPYNEGLQMRAWLIDAGVPAERIVVDPFARHSTTNLRNAGRVMLAAGLSRALIVTGFESSFFDQAFYFAHPILSTFYWRCRSELGYRVGDLNGVDDHRASFTPAAECATLDYRDPLDC